MTDGEILLEAIKADPADDLPRLQYADWCEETGRQDRADFIRCQMGGGFPPDLPGCMFWEWFGGGLGAALPGSPSARWTTRGPQRMEWVMGFGSPQWSVTLRRGFVSRVRCPLAAWMAHGPAIAAAHPLERVELTDKRPWIDALDDQHVWWWGGEDDGAVASVHWVLPAGVFDALRGHDAFGIENRIIRARYSAEDNILADDVAHDALSDALIRHARAPSQTHHARR